jgi:hypothetical protein
VIKVPLGLSLIVVSLGVFGMPGGAVAHASKLRVVVSVPGQGYPTTAIATAARIRRPAALYARVTVDPKQQARITYHLSCIKQGATTARTATWSGVSGTLARLKLPVAKPTSCSATAQATVSDVRSLRLQILAD